MAHTPKASKKKKRKRNLYALYKIGNHGSRRWKNDFDYIDKLSEKEKVFLNDFIEEYYLANFQQPGKKLHKTKEAKRKIYYENNVSNRCVMSLHNCKGAVTTNVAISDPTKVNELIDMYYDHGNVEEDLATYLDLANDEEPKA